MHKKVRERSQRMTIHDSFGGREGMQITISRANHQSTTRGLEKCWRRYVRLADTGDIMDGYKRMGYDNGKGCWQLYNPFFYDLDHIELNFICQGLKSNEPFKFSHKITGKFRDDRVNSYKFQLTL